MQPRKEGSSSSSNSFQVTKSGADVGARGNEELDVAGVVSGSDNDDEEDEDEDSDSVVKCPRVGF